MTSSHHGTATLTEDVYDGTMAVVVEVHGEKLMMSDREFRDLLLCAYDLFPSAFQWSPDITYQRVGNERAAEDGDPTATLPEGVDGYRFCRQCGHKLAQIPQENPVFCGDECEHNWRQSEYRGWYPR